MIEKEAFVQKIDDVSVHLIEHEACGTNAFPRHATVFRVGEEHAFGVRREVTTVTVPRLKAPNCVVFERQRLAVFGFGQRRVVSGQRDQLSGLELTDCWLTSGRCQIRSRSPRSEVA